MKKVLVIGASGSLAKVVTEELMADRQIALTLFLRNKNRLNTMGNALVVTGNALNYSDVSNAMDGQDVVYVNLAGDLVAMTQIIVKAMKANGVKRIIFISSIGIYGSPLKSVLRPYREGADVIENSGLDYTVLRPAWFTNDLEVDYEITKKGTPEKGSVISRKSIAHFIHQLIQNPDTHIGESLGINTPNS
ncbi:NAD(P)H-binding protein [Neptunitalea lumnitzerae]|uniref:NAD-dependent dehydratase n=1 Tax=Neptunitalea lumnitzerae TaxID=2965509 RepID=A0ABQ5MEZ6_9FLAO|nr:NAD(P)H-binding protein [Neptunitalea sp. Y10]GLB47964.1 NAD-dependent dehydratase [Neptunitalea sp. Y10]